VNASKTGGGMNNTEDAQLSALHVRTSALESGLVEIKGLIGGLSAKFDSHTRTPWVVIFSGMSIVGAILGGYINIQLQPINRGLDQVTIALDKVQERYMPARDIEQKFADLRASLEDRQKIASARRDDWQHTSEEMSARNAGAIEKLQDRVVPLEWHKQKWEANDRELADIRDVMVRTFEDKQRQIDEVKKFQSDLVSAPNFLKSIDERLRMLEEKMK
jgi:hypothetical protein